MARCNDPTDPAQMTPEERLAEVAAILGAGILRLYRRQALPPTSAMAGEPSMPSETARMELDLPPEKSVTGPRG
jgi:hypothetical protein